MMALLNFPRCQETYLMSVGLPLSTPVALQLHPNDLHRFRGMLQWHFAATGVSYEEICLQRGLAMPTLEPVIEREGQYRFHVTDKRISVKDALFIDDEVAHV